METHQQNVGNAVKQNKLVNLTFRFHKSSANFLFEIFIFDMLFLILFDIFIRNCGPNQVSGPVHKKSFVTSIIN